MLRILNHTICENTKTNTGKLETGFLSFLSYNFCLELTGFLLMGFSGLSTPVDPVWDMWYLYSLVAVSPLISVGFSFWPGGHDTDSGGGMSGLYFVQWSTVSRLRWSVYHSKDPCNMAVDSISCYWWVNVKHLTKFVFMEKFA